ncbi:MAG: M42 family metallopeptidase [Planctomycetota bacterium]
MSPQDFLHQAILTPSPSGYEEPIQRLIRDYLSGHTDDVSIDVHGNLTARVGTPGGPKLMLAGHCDQIGMLISHIDEDGFLYAQTIGGWDPQQLIGQSMTIWTAEGPVPAVISRKPIHLLTPKERGDVVQLDQMWLDIGAADKDAAAARVRVGDPVTLHLIFRPLLGDRVSGPGMDNKSGMWTVVETARRCAETNGVSPLACDLYSVATVQEEIGLRGAKTAAARINPDVAIAIDVTHASDCPTVSKQTQGDIRLGRGPVIVRGPNVNAKVAEGLMQLADEHEIPYQLAALGRAAPNDSNALQISGSGVATGLVAIPNRYMHSAVETIDHRDIELIAQLLTLFAQSLTPDCSFIPG